MNHERLKYLFERYCERTCSSAERQELAILCLLPENEIVLKELMEGAWARASLSKEMPEDEAGLILQKILHQPSQQTLTGQAKTRNFHWSRWIAAASALLILVAASYFLFFNKTDKPAVATTVTQPVSNDVQAPKIVKATITLADGGRVSVDSLTSLTQNNVSLTKTADGKIVYSGSASKVVYNTLTNPRGSKVIDMTLADGSHVWLNAGSSVTYPVAFVGNERKVLITGEAYFEVAPLSLGRGVGGEAKMPFIVEKGNMEVTVLGTHFNVNAYDDESDIKVTLLEGSVKVRNEAGAVTIKPGQQATANRNEKPQIISNINLEQVMAWKNGMFVFNETDIQSIMRQIERWYDVEVVFDGAFTQHFNGAIQRQVNVSKVLDMLQKTGGARFTIEGKKVMVKKY